jgi:signal transduction histidine kinase
VAMKMVLCIAIILLEIAAVSYVAIILKKRQDDHVTQTFDTVSTRVTSFLQTQMNNLMFLNTRNAGALSLTGPYLSLDEFKTVLQLQHDNSSSQVEAYEHIVRLRSSDISKFNVFCKAKITRKCFLKELSAADGGHITLNSTFVPAERDRTEYFAVLYFSPLAETFEFIESLIGFDLLSYGPGKVELDQFQATGVNSAVTRQIRLVRPSVNPNSYGVIIGTPVLKASVITGYAACVIRLATIIDSAIETIAFRRSDISVVMFDTTQDAIADVAAHNVSLLYREMQPESYHSVWHVSDMMDYNSRREFDFLNRHYTVFFKYASNYEERLRNDLPLAIPLIIACLLFLLDVIVYLLRTTIKRKRDILDGVRANRMLSYTNHEFRNPLNIIKGMVTYSLTTLQESPPQVQQCISDLLIVVRTCNFLEHIISDILVLQQLEDNELELHPQHCVLSDVMTDVQQSVAQKMEEIRNVKLIVDCDCRIVLYIDVFRLKQIMLNLVSNSMKYTQRGAISIIVKTQTDQSTVIQVKDTGSGIPLDRQHLVFHEHLHKNTKDVARHGASGLGLYLVKLLVDRMKWRISFESTVNVGTLFSVHIPADCAVANNSNV